MSTFRVEPRRICFVQHHPNADRLDLCRVEGLAFQFVTGRDQYRVGDRVIYFPVDSLLPDWIVERLGLTGKLAGASNRVKTVKLRGSVSQGLVCSPDQLPEVPADRLVEGEDLSELLGVKKYEVFDAPPSGTTFRDQALGKLPIGVEVYDLEGCDRYAHIVDTLIATKTPVWVSEKLEGSNFSCTVDADDKVWVSQRRFTIVESEAPNHVFWSSARRQGLLELTRSLREHFQSSSLTIRGEMVGPGIQGNHYKLDENRIFLFDVMADTRYVDVHEFFDALERCLPGDWSSYIVPTLAKDVTLDTFLMGRTVQEASDGPSLLGPVPREGIVIKLMREQWHPEIGRLVLKQRGPLYLAGSDL